MCMVEGLPLQSLQDQISEWFSLGRFKNHWRQERKGGTYKIVRQRPATTYEQRHKNVLISQRMKVCRTRYCTMQLCCYASNDWEATRVEKGKLLKEIWSWNPKRGLHCPLTQLIKKKASASVCRRWIQTWLVGLVGAADQSESSGSHFKLRRLDECVWWRVCHSKGCRIKSQSDFPWEGLKITGDKKEKGANIRSSKIIFFSFQN